MSKGALIFSIIILSLSGLNYFTPDLVRAAPKKNFIAQGYEKVHPFITSQKIPCWGEIVGSKEGAVNLAVGDLVYVKLEPQKRVKPGDHFLIGRETEVISHPQTKKEMGYLVLIPGELVILGAEGNIVPAKIHKSSQPIWEGDKIYLSPLLPPAETFIKGNKKISGQILFSITKTKNITQREYIFIDRGSQDGVILGTVFKIYQTGYFSDRINKGAQEKLPKFTVGEAVVVSVQKESSTAIVTNSSQTIYPGDEVISSDK